MGIRQRVEKSILKITEKMFPPVIFDRLLIERRRRVNNVTGYYPEAVFFSKKRSDKKYCVVRYTRPTFGIMAAGIQYVFCYYQLKERGYIPLIDIEFAYSYRSGRLGENNLWDLCFEQPISVQEVAKQPYVLAAGPLFSYSDDSRVSLSINGDADDHFIHVRREDFREYYAKVKKYVEPIWVVKPEVIAELDEEVWNKVNGKRVLGVFLRENFTKDVLKKNKADADVYENHPLLPGVMETVDIIKTKLKLWKYDFIFLSTLYTDSLQIFKDEFGDKVIYTNRPRLNIAEVPVGLFDMNEKELYEEGIIEQDKRAKITRTYVEEIIALSRCNYLVGGGSSGMIAALIMNGGRYDDIYILQDERKIQRY